MLVKLQSVVGIPGKTRQRKMSYSPHPIARGAGDVGFDFPSPLTAALTLTGQSRGALIAIDLRGRARALCDRCLRGVAVPVEASGYVEVRPEPGPDDEDVLVLTASGEVDLGPVVEEMVALAMPMKVVCRDDCRGLCPRCGIDLNQGSCDCEAVAPDPRMAALQRLKADLETERK